MKQNYQKEMEGILAKEETAGKRLLLHSCCAPCSSYVLVSLREIFRITVFYYNPNITRREEYEKRFLEQERLIKLLNAEGEGYPIALCGGEYAPALFWEASRGLETCPEGGARCRACFALRLEETARTAARQGADYFTTTLTVSPLKNAEVINRVGQEAAERFAVPFLPSDFKKKDGYRQSVALSRRYGLYRQDYCGCVFSERERADKRGHGIAAGQ